MAQLTAEEKLVINEHVNKQLTKIAAFVGIANVAVVAVALFSFWSVANSQIGRIADDVKTEVLDDLSTSQEEFRDAISRANQLVGRLSEREAEVDNIDEQLERLRAALQVIQASDLAAAGEFLRAWNETESVERFMVSLRDVVASDAADACDTVRAYSGTEGSAEVDWVEYRDDGTAMYADIDTSAANFGNTPLYFTSIGGRAGHWSANGVNAIYNPHPDGFRVYINWASDDDILEYARSQSWHIDWLAVGC